MNALLDAPSWVYFAIAAAAVPFAFVLTTAYAKVIVVLTLLRTAIGADGAPPNHVLAPIAILLSLYVMAPVLGEMQTALVPLVEQSEEAPADVGLALRTASAPVRGFLERNTPPADVARVAAIAGPTAPNPSEPASWLHLVTAFVFRELTEAFAMGVALFLPFLALDVLVSVVLVSGGLAQLSPSNLSLMLKLMLFVAVDGWFALLRALSAGYA